MDGASWSMTVTVAAQESAAPCESVAVRVTLLVPFVYGPEGAWVSVMTSPASGSKEPLFTNADAAVQPFGSVVTITFLHMACGG